MRDKLKLTRQIVEQLPYVAEVSVEELLPLWWKNVRNDSGMRLTDLGYTIFVKHLKLTEYTFKLEPFDLGTYTIIQLDHKLQHPYYIEFEKGMATKLVLFDSKEAMLANLYGNIEKFVDNYNV